MKLLTIEAIPFQQFDTTSESGVSITFTMRYLPTQLLWSMSIESSEITASNIAVVNSINLLGPFVNNSSFGLFVGTIDNFDPYYIDDFANQRAVFGLLNATEAQGIENNVFEV